MFFLVRRGEATNIVTRIRFRICDTTCYNIITLSFRVVREKDYEMNNSITYLKYHSSTRAKWRHFQSWKTQHQNKLTKEMKTQKWWQEDFHLGLSWSSWYYTIFPDGNKARYNALENNHSNWNSKSKHPGEKRNAQRGVLHWSSCFPLQSSEGLQCRS